VAATLTLPASFNIVLSGHVTREDAILLALIQLLTKVDKWQMSLMH